MLWLKALHVIAVMSWMAGLLYLPRLFVYHAEAKPESEAFKTFKVMEERLLRIIMTPAMMVVWITGLVLAWGNNFWLDGWFLAKLALVVAMTVFHGKLASWRKEFAADDKFKPPKFYRVANEIPTLLMVLIVILVIVKPF